ncbi:MAG: hypothetical protein FJ405_17645, partial [Verrucomicrobia bacterium]|nr:hypothetical protein [Verrucomicrobiota bacterium]
MKRQLVSIASLSIFAGSTAMAQIDGNDPTLRLWLKTDGLTEPQVSVWEDSSSSGLRLEVPPLPPGDQQNDLENHTPRLINVQNAGLSFKAVRFRQANDPLNAPGHLADRLWQVNKLDDTDPTHITPDMDITMIVVYQNRAPNVTLGGHQAIFAKRGPSSCPYLFGLDGTKPAHELIQYAGSVVYGSGMNIPTQSEWGLVIFNITTDGTMTWKEYYASRGGWRSNTQTGIPRAGSAIGVPFTIGFHVQGAGGNAANPWGNGTYERFSGDIAEFALYNRSLTAEEQTAVETELLVKYFLQGGPPTVKTQPQSLQVNQFDAANFTVVADGTPPFSYQWRKGDVVIPGANGTSYSIPSADLADAGSYTVVVSTLLGSVTSDPAVLTVNTDKTAPAVQSALLDLATTGNPLNNVVVTFTELVDQASATDRSRYQIDQGVTVDSVAPVPQTSNPAFPNHVFAVVLSVSPVTATSQLTVTGVKDRANNASSANATILYPVTEGVPSTQNLVLWLAGDVGVEVTDDRVTRWVDQSGAENPHDATVVSGKPKMTSAPFPNALHPVVRFDGSSWMRVANQPDLNLQDLSIYLVASVDTTRPSRNWLGNWEGWVLGSADGNGASIKWSHWQVGNVYRPLESGPVLENNVPAYIVGTIDSTTQTKTLSVNGRVRGTQTGTGTIEYATSRGLGIGTLFDDAPTQLL